MEKNIMKKVDFLWFIKFHLKICKFEKLYFMVACANYFFQI